jgi:hypothetical protein
MTKVTVRHEPEEETAPVERRFGLIRQNYQGYALKLHSQYPEVADLTARITAIIAEETKGEWPIFRLWHSEEVWSDIVDGKKQPHLNALARVFTSRRPKARAAKAKILALLASHCAEAATSEPKDTLASLIEMAGAVLGGMTRDIKDGVIDESEALARLPLIKQLRDQVTLAENHYATALRGADSREALR